MNRFAASFIPDDGCLPLVRDADGIDPARGELQEFADALHDRLPDLLRVMFNPACLWIDLRQLAVCPCKSNAVFIVDDAGSTGCALINGKNGHKLIVENRYYPSEENTFS